MKSHMFHHLVCWTTHLARYEMRRVAIIGKAQNSGLWSYPRLTWESGVWKEGDTVNVSCLASSINWYILTYLLN